MDKNYTVVETSKIAAVRGGGHNYSLICEDDVMNGALGFVGDLSEEVDGLETHEFLIPSKLTINKGKVILVANPEWDYDETSRTNQALYNYINEAGKIFRGYDLMAHDVFALSVGGFNLGGKTAPESGDYVILEEGKTTLKIANATEIAGQGFYGKVIGSAKRGLGWKTAGGKVFGRPYIVYFVEVLRNDVVASYQPSINLMTAFDLTADVDLLGKRVTDLQENIEVTDDVVSGTLKMVTDYTGFSSIAEEQSGNYIAMYCEANPNATITVELVGGRSGAVTLDDDGLIVLRVTDPSQSIRVVASANGYESAVKVFSLSGLTLQNS